MPGLIKNRLGDNTILNQIRDQISKLHQDQLIQIRVNQQLHRDLESLKAHFKVSEADCRSTDNQASKSAWSELSSPPSNAPDQLRNEIAEHITAVVGLKEAIMWKHRFLKWLWAIALLVGVAATIYFVCASAGEYFENPTATKVEMKQQEEYEYPPFLLCHDAWLDVDKALSLGLSLDALQYSFGYLQLGINMDNVNVTSAKELFRQVYNKHNFSSLDEYYKEIAIDVDTETQLDKFVSNKNNSSAFCPACTNFLPRKKIILNGRVCYLFQYAPENGGKSRKPVHNFSMGIALQNRTRGFVSLNPIWRMYLTTDTDLILKYNIKSALSLHSYLIVTARITTQRFISLKEGAMKCVDQGDVGANYSAESCYGKCLSDVYSKNLGCRQFSETISDDKKISLEDYCNDYDTQASGGIWAQADQISGLTENITKSNPGVDCVKNCPVKCDRVVYDVTVRAQIEANDTYDETRAVLAESKRSSVSTLILDIEHGAIFDGGILTLTEVSTISFISMVSNLGGALGLFVGGTMMTFVQVVLFMIKYIVDRKSQAR